ncbi:MAG: NYN domain-containing protein [Clostridia bacterium]|nr:NYN domain-containing protein [Clostridia bacterium]
MVYVDMHGMLPDEIKGPPKSSNFENYRTDIVTTVAYLIGVSDDVIESSTSPFNPEVAQKLREDESASIIRSLSLLRKGFLINYEKIRNGRRELKQFEDMDDLIKVEEIEYLRKFSMDIPFVNVKNSQDPAMYIAYINQFILDRIQAVKPLFPDWVKFDYIRNLFLMPGGYAGHHGENIDTQQQKNKVSKAINDEKNKYRPARKSYPYGAYLNWPKTFRDTDGNILLNDNKFLKLLYGANGDTFTASEYVIDAKEEKKESIYSFISKAQKISVFVDCENVSPYSFVAMILNLDEGNLGKINKIYLFDDANTSSAWKFIGEYITTISIERTEFDRVLGNKSLVDTAMSSGITREFYSENTESIIIVSSDSDFWGCISILPEARFYVLNESSRTAKAILDKLDENNIEHCFMDDFAQDRAQEFKSKVLVGALNERIKKFNETGAMETLNVWELIDSIFAETYVMGAPRQIEQEKEQFYKTFLKNGFVLAPEEDDEGVIWLRMERKRTK